MAFVQNKIGLLEEHAPVQAIYVGCRVDGTLARPRVPNQTDYSNWVVRPGQILFAPMDDMEDSDTPRVIANLNGYDERQKLWPYGIAHDSVLDGKLAADNPTSVAGISAIVSGCVTIQVPCTDDHTYFVGDSVFVELSNGIPERMRHMRYEGMPDYVPPRIRFSRQGQSRQLFHYCRLGTIVEMYPNEYGVIRVCLDIQAYNSELSSPVVDKCMHPTIAPQHPVYVGTLGLMQTTEPARQWKEGYPALFYDFEFAHQEPNRYATDYMPAMGVDCAVLNDPVTPNELLECHGVIADTRLEKNNDSHINPFTSFAVVLPAYQDLKPLQPASVAIGGAVSLILPKNYPVGCNLPMRQANIAAKVLARNGESGEHYVLLDTQGQQFDDFGGDEYTIIHAHPTDVAADFESTEIEAADVPSNLSPPAAKPNPPKAKKAKKK